MEPVLARALLYKCIEYENVCDLLNQLNHT